MDILITIFNDMWNTLINNPVYFAIAFLGVGGILAVIIQGIVALIGEYTAAFFYPQPFQTYFSKSPAQL